MRIKESLFYTVRILVGINVAMMGTVVASPLFDMVLPGTSTEKRKYESQGCASGVGSVCPEAVIAYLLKFLFLEGCTKVSKKERAGNQRTSNDGKGSCIRIQHSKQKSPCMNRNPRNAKNCHQRNCNKHECVSYIHRTKMA